MILRPLLIVGTGGLAREVLAVVRALNAVHAHWKVVGLLDDDPRRHGVAVSGVPVLGPPEAVHDHPDAAVVLCTASPRDRASRFRLWRRLGLDAQRYAALVHPAAAVAPSTAVAPGAVLLAGVVATADVTLGEHTVVMPGCVLTHDGVVEDFATLAAGVRLGGAVRVSTGAYVGAATAVREERQIGDWSLVGMGSVVLHDVPAFEVWWGAPARFRRTEVPTGVVVQPTAWRAAQPG